VEHPSSGNTQFRYDAAGRLEKKITANGDIIQYGYFHDKLTSIRYPRHPENNVLYVYGTNNGDRDLRNRLVYQEDASGAQQFKYGSLGEITETVRTIIAPFNSNPFTFKTIFEYDTWNRIRSVTYPDGDTVKYAYNRAGLLESVKSRRAQLSALPKAMDYVSRIGYDEFEQRVFIQYGNNTQTSYTYQPERRRLDQLKVEGINNASAFFTAFRSAYTYDNRDNITANLITKTKAGVAGTMRHQYWYDNLNRLDSASGKWDNTLETATYNLDMEFDELFNVSRKALALTSGTRTQPGQAFAPKVNVNYTDAFFYDGGNAQQLNRVTGLVQTNNTEK
jgi:YD repeat-containing protein